MFLENYVFYLVGGLNLNVIGICFFIYRLVYLDDIGIIFYVDYNVIKYQNEERYVQIIIVVFGKQLFSQCYLFLMF